MEQKLWKVNFCKNHEIVSVNVEAIGELTAIEKAIKIFKHKHPDDYNNCNSISCKQIKKT